MRYENGKLIRETRPIPVMEGDKVVGTHNYTDPEPLPQAEKLALYVIDKFGVPDNVFTTGGGYVGLCYPGMGGLPWNGQANFGFALELGNGVMHYNPRTGAGFAYCNDHKTEEEFLQGIDWCLQDLKTRGSKKE